MLSKYRDRIKEKCLEEGTYVTISKFLLQEVLEDIDRTSQINKELKDKLSSDYRPYASYLTEVATERAFQDAKWGPDRKLPPTLWMTIIMEELGEAAEALLEKSDNYRHELIQVSASALAAVESFDLQSK